jgi:hypothetical protein
MKHSFPSSSFISTRQLDDDEDLQTKLFSFNAIIEDRSSNNLVFTIILDERTGRYRRESQEIRPENSREESRDRWQMKDERAPTGRSTALEPVYEFKAFIYRIACLDSMYAPYRGNAIEKANASLTPSRRKTSCQRSIGKGLDGIYMWWIGSGSREDWFVCRRGNKSTFGNQKNGRDQVECLTVSLVEKLRF